MSAHPIVLGTAGHVDHGKTSLVRALTGIDTDRLPEEKARGITIELGFAHLQIGSTRFGLVDVPGHERFVRAMVAGAVGIDIVILVVAADEGVMPQTREHLDICRLLGVRGGVVALTKRDAVDDAFRTLVMDDLGGFLRDTFLEEAPIVPCSAVTGEGIDDLKRTLVELAGRVPSRDPEGLFRLPLDRVFTMHGFGTVVTGTLASGRIKVGDDVVALPSGHAAKVRGVEVHGEAVDEALAGQRTAINLGGLPREDVERGEVLVRPGTLAAGSIVDVRLSVLEACGSPLRRRSKALFHAGTTMVEASVWLVDQDEIAPGRSGFAQLRLSRPVVVLPGDRFILRGFAVQPGYGTTLGGGSILRVLGPKLRHGGPEAAAVLARLESADPEMRIAEEVRLAGFAGLGRNELQARVAATPRAVDAALGRLLSRRTLIRFDREQGGMVHAEALGVLGTRLRAVVERAHSEAPERPGVPREELRSRLPDEVPARLFQVALEEALATGDLVAERDLVRLRGHSVATAATSIASLAERLLALLQAAGLAPPRMVDLPRELDVSPATAQAVVDYLVQNDRVVRVGRELVFARPIVDALRERLVTHLRSQGSIDPQGWKEMCGTSRKYSIPLAEHFDAERLTLRVGDLRKLRG